MCSIAARIMLRQRRKHVRKIAALPRIHVAALPLNAAINWARRMFFKREMQQLHRHPKIRKKTCAQILRGRSATPTCQRSQRHDSCVIYVCIINMLHLHISATHHGRLARRRRECAGELKRVHAPTAVSGISKDRSNYAYEPAYANRFNH